jgi:acyl dehydratase
MKYYEDIAVGQKFAYPAHHDLTAAEIIRIAAEWDPQPFHLDEAAAKQSIFGGLVASSVHLFAITNRLCHSDEEKWATVSALGMREIKNHAPARPGDRLTARSICLDKRPSASRPGLGIVEFDVQLLNQKGEVLYSYVSAALLRMRSQAG